MKAKLRKTKTKLKIDKAYFYAPYIPIFRGSVKKLKHIWKLIMKDERRNEIFKDVEE